MFLCVCFFFCKQKTAYDMRISDWSSDVCSSDLYSPNTYTFTKGQASTTATPTYSGGSPTSCTASPALPTGLNIDATTCTISGTPTALSTVPVMYSVIAANSAGSTTATEIGKAPGWERMCQYSESTGVAVSLKKKKKT